MSPLEHKPPPATPKRGRRQSDKPDAQRQLETEAMIIASRAYERADQVDGRVTELFGVLSDKIDKSEKARAEQHEENKAQLTWIQRAMWGAAIGLIGLLLTVLFTRIH